MSNRRKPQKICGNVTDVAQNFIDYRRTIKNVCVCVCVCVCVFK